VIAPGWVSSRGVAVGGVVGEVVGSVNVSLAPELDELLNEQVRRGRDTSAIEVGREAIRLLQNRDELRRLRHAESRM